MNLAVAAYPEDWMVRRLVLRRRPLCPCGTAPGRDDAAMAIVASTHPSAQAARRVWAERLYERGADAADRQDFATAAPLLEQALASEGSMHDLYRAAIELAWMDSSQGRDDAAAVHAQRAIALVPEASRAYVLLGYAHERRHRLDEALAAYVAGADRGDAQAQMRAGVLLMQAGDHAPADALGGARRLLVAANLGDETARENLRRHPELLAAQALAAPHDTSGAATPGSRGSR